MSTAKVTKKNLKTIAYLKKILTFLLYHLPCFCWGSFSYRWDDPPAVDGAVTGLGPGVHHPGGLAARAPLGPGGGASDTRDVLGATFFSEEMYNSKGEQESNDS